MQELHRPSTARSQHVPVEVIERRIHVVRGRKVMLDSDLAELYEVLTKNLNRTVRRNVERFPDDFMLVLTDQELRDLRFQFGTSSFTRRPALQATRFYSGGHCDALRRFTQ